MSAAVRGHVHVLDDDADVRDALDSFLRAEGFTVTLHRAPDDFLAAYDGSVPACLLLDIRLEGADGLEVQTRLQKLGLKLPVVIMTGHGDVPMAVRGMKAGAVDFLSKPFSDSDLLAALAAALAADEARGREDAALAELRSRYDNLTPREREVAAFVAAGLMNKQICFRLDLELSTVKIHRGHVMRKMAADSLADLVRMFERLDLRPPGGGRYGRPL